MLRDKSWKIDLWCSNERCLAQYFRDVAYCFWVWLSDLGVWLSDIGMWLSVLGALAHCFVIGKDCMSCVTTLNRLKLILGAA